MSDLGPGPNYTPTFSMPVIVPQPPGADAATYYASVTATTTIDVTQVPNHDKQLKIALSNANYGELFAMAGGLVAFIPAGDPLPTGESSPGAGSLILQTWAVDVNLLKRRGLPMISVFYLNVKPDTVRAALEPIVRDRGRFADSVLRNRWDLVNPPADRTQMEDCYLDRILLGENAVFVPGGTPLGDAGLRDPNDAASPVEFTLHVIDGAGNDVLPVPYLRSIPRYNGSQWTGHPLIDAVANIPVPVNIYLQFEVWNETTHAFEPLPAGVSVDLMDYDPIDDDRLITTQTDDRGRVQFSSSLEALADLDPDDDETDIYFLVHTNGMTHAGHTLPEVWSTKGWRAADGKLGYYEDFTGTQLGDANHPMMFRIGLDVHAKLRYRDNRTHTDEKAPKGTLISIWTGVGQREVQKTILHTDENGEVHGVLFDIDAGHDLYFHTDFEIEDDLIHLPRARVNTYWDDGNAQTDIADIGDIKVYPNNHRTSLGKQNQPDILDCTFNERNVAIFFLKILREFSTFLFHMTGGDWTGINDLVLYRTAIGGTSYSWPIGAVNIAPDKHWDRGVIVHELSHQIMWKEADFSSPSVALEAMIGQLHMVHYSNVVYNAEHALIEGWAAFFDAVFADTNHLPSERTDLVFGNPDQPDEVSRIRSTRIFFENSDEAFGNLPRNWGYRIEAAFAYGLWAIFKKYIASNARVPESTNGDVTTRARWIQDTNVRDRFLSIIWNPLKRLGHLSTDPNSIDMIDFIRQENVQQWHVLQAELQNLNMAMEPPTLSSITPVSGSSSGSQAVTLTGNHFLFVLPTRVIIGGARAIDVHVTSSTSLTARTPPGAAGLADVVVNTPAGSATLPNGYTYV